MSDLSAEVRDIDCFCIPEANSRSWAIAEVILTTTTAMVKSLDKEIARCPTNLLDMHWRSSPHSISRDTRRITVVPFRVALMERISSFSEEEDIAVDTDEWAEVEFLVITEVLGDSGPATAAS